LTKILTALILTAILAGCANHVPLPAEPTPEISGESITDDNFIMVLKFNDPSILDNTTDRQAISTAKTLCDFLENGGTATEVFLVLSSSGLSDEQLAIFAGAGVGSYCPEMIDKFR
jgi:hypothetical protein